MKRILAVAVVLAVLVACIPATACGPAFLCAPPPRPVAVVPVATTQVVVVQQPVVIPAYFVQYNPTIFQPNVSFQMQAQYERQYQMPAPQMPSMEQEEYRMFLKLKAKYGAMPCPPGCTPAGEAKGSGQGSGTDVLPGDDEDKALYKSITSAGCFKCHSTKTAGGPKGSWVMDLSDGSLPHFSNPERREIAKRISADLSDKIHMPPASEPQIPPDALDKFKTQLLGQQK
jgi:hypothetical protein